jgi:large subunit ribosomal protein L13e
LSNVQDNTLVPIALPAQPSAFSERKIDESEKEGSQYIRLRKARSDARLLGKREKRAKAKAEEEAAKGKK